MGVAMRAGAGRKRAVLVVPTLGVVALSAGPAEASENIVGVGNAAFDNTMIIANRQDTAMTHTTPGSGVLSNIGQLPLEVARNGGAGGGVPGDEATGLLGS